MENMRKGKDVQHIELKKLSRTDFFFGGGEDDCDHYSKWNAYLLNDFLTKRQFRPQSAVLPGMY